MKKQVRSSNGLMSLIDHPTGQVNENASFKDFHPTYNMCFDNGSADVGKLYWADGELKFEGNIHESAKLFFEFLKPYVDEYIKNGGEK